MFRPLLIVVLVMLLALLLLEVSTARAQTLHGPSGSAGVAPASVVPPYAGGANCPKHFAPGDNTVADCPTVSEWGLIGLVAAMLPATLIVQALRRRRMAA